MKRFIAQHASKITGVLSGFDRLVIRGTLRKISYTAGMFLFLCFRRVLLKDFGRFADDSTARLKNAIEDHAERLGRPAIYLPSSQTNKETRARDILEKDGAADGLIAIFKTLEMAQSFDLYRNAKMKKLELTPRVRRSLHYYCYLQDPVFGFMHARIQTWFPFRIQVGLNGREWLARQMDAAGLNYRRRDNCFVWIEDIEAAQRLMDLHLKTDWPKTLNRFAQMLNPVHRHIFGSFNVDYYWSVYQSEWATDLAFAQAKELAKLYPAFVRHGIESFSSLDVMRFLGHRLRQSTFEGEIVSGFKGRAEGVRLKHWVNSNSVKIYDKQGSVLRVETTVNNPRVFKVWRRSEAGTKDDFRWRPLRKGVADLHRLAKVSQSSNARYLEALAAVDTSTPLGELIRPVTRPVTFKGRRVRGLRPWSDEDLALFKAVGRGEFALNGFRNRDLQPHLFTAPAKDDAEHRRHSAKISRLLRLLRAHQLIRKIAHTHRYQITQKGRDLMTPLLVAQVLTPLQLSTVVA